MSISTYTSMLTEATNVQASMLTEATNVQVRLGVLTMLYYVQLY